MKLNLGCADRHLPGFANVDICHPCDQLVDLTGPWPWPDSSVTEVMALDVCEHISARHYTLGWVQAPDSNRPVTTRGVDGRVHFMNEIHRVLKPGARATIETPNAARGVGYFQDPTHASPYCMSTFKYFEHGSFAHTRLAKSYGITAAFRILEMKDLGPMPSEGFGEQVWKIHVELEAIK